MTNEELSQVVSLDMDVNPVDEYKLEIKGNWKWNEVPQDGIIGEDYIGISVLNSSGVSVSGPFLNGKLQLTFQDEIIYETEGHPSENGYLFSFPNELKDQIVFGNEGEFSIIAEPQQKEDVQVIVSYLHTWSEHGGLSIGDSRFLSPQFEKGPIESYWVIERFEEGMLTR